MCTLKIKKTLENGRRGAVHNIKFIMKKVFNLDEEKKGHLATRSFWQGKKAENVLFLFLTVGTRGIYLSLTLGTARFKQQD